MNVPLLDLQAQYRPIRNEILAAIARVCDTQRFVLGEEVDLFEREIAAHIGVEHAVGMSSGTDALLAALMALQIGPGDEVITSTYSFFATAGCVTRVGARPVLVDIDPTTYNLDPHAVARAITSRTRAIIPVHLFGLMADMAPIVEAARERHIAVIEDACQAIGAAYHGEPAGSVGTSACFSFFPSKNLGAFGDAGLVTTNESALAHLVRVVRGHGAERKYFHTTVGGNFRLDALQAAILRVKLPHVTAWTEARRRNARRYAELFAERGLAEQAALPVEPAGYRHVYNQYVIRSSRRDGLRVHLSTRGIGTEVYYPVPFHLQACFAPLGYRAGDFPFAEAAAHETLALPIYGELSLEQQAYVVDCIREFELSAGD